MIPYSPGDRVQVLMTPIGGESEWIDAAVIDCHQPKHARRFALTVCIGMTNNTAFISNRIYCNADGTGEEIRAIATGRAG